MTVPRQSSNWDEHRNTSRVFPVDPRARPDADRALRAWAAANPAHAQWIIDGYPNLTEAEHFARFGERHPGRARPTRRAGL